jgi:hypothetical protein
MVYLIFSPTETEKNGERMYWSNEFGWCDYDSAERFAESDRKSLKLPFGGEWIVE